MGDCKPVEGSRAYLEIQPDGSHKIIHDYSNTNWGKLQNGEQLHPSISDTRSSKRTS